MSLRPSAPSAPAAAPGEEPPHADRRPGLAFLHNPPPSSMRGKRVYADTDMDDRYDGNQYDDPMLPLGVVSTDFRYGLSAMLASELQRLHDSDHMGIRSAMQHNGLPLVKDPVRIFSWFEDKSEWSGDEEANFWYVSRITYTDAVSAAGAAAPAADAHSRDVAAAEAAVEAAKSGAGDASTLAAAEEQALYVKQEPAAVIVSEEDPRTVFLPIFGNVYHNPVPPESLGAMLKNWESVTFSRIVPNMPLNDPAFNNQTSLEYGLPTFTQDVTVYEKPLKPPAWNVSPHP